MARSRLVKEGSVGLFLLLGLIVFGGIIFFINGGRLQNNRYQVKLRFQNAGGLTEGGKVLYRGVEVGKIKEISPSSNGVEVTAEIDSQLPIPEDITVSTLKSGLLGEVSISLTPERKLDDTAKSINPLSDDCLEQNLILCNNQVIEGKASPDLIVTLTRLSDLYSDEELFNNINNAVANIAEAGEKAAKLSDDLSDFMAEVKQDIDNVSVVATKFQTTAEAITETATIATEQINDISTNFKQTSAEISTLATNINGLIEGNQVNLIEAIADFNQTTKEIGKLANNADNLVTKFDRSLNENEVKDLVANLEKATANFSEISDNLLAVSQQINDPSNLVTLQQTLDSARVTFANTAKITSDLDEITGNPEFRRNLRRLVDGLGDLVSYTELLEKQVQLAMILESAQQEVQANYSLTQSSQFQPQSIELGTQNSPSKTTTP